MNTKVKLGGLAAAVALAALTIGGVVLAQTPSPGTQPAAGQGQANQTDRRSRIDDFLNQLAQNLHIGRPALDDALKTTAKQQIESAVSSGRLTRDRANQIEQRIDSGQFPAGFGGFGRDRGEARPAAACGADTRQAILGALGVTADEVRQARQNGQSIAQIAQAHGKTEQDLQTAANNALKSCLDKQVQAGTLTQQQEQDILQRAQQHRGQNGLPGRRGQGAPGSQFAPATGRGTAQ